MLPFLSGELTELELRMTTQIPSMINDVFKAIAHRTPNLTSFYLDARVQGIAVDGSLAKWLATLTNLEETFLPSDYLTSGVIRALGSLPRLAEIRQSTEHPSDSPRALQCLLPGTFPLLVYIAFTASLPEARRFLLASQEVGSRLANIVLHAVGGLDLEDILNFTRQVAQNCPRMTELGLDLFKRPGPGEPYVSSLTMALLESLFPCEGLKVLRIGHPCPFTFQEEDVERMGQAWPQMINLDVCFDPDFSFHIARGMGNSLSILSVFAHALPNLEVLGLYLNEQEAPSFTGNLYPQCQFQKLTEMRFGLSPVPGGLSRQVGFYLASLCKERPTIKYGRSSWHPGTRPSDWAQRKSNWKEVVDMTGFAMEVKRGGLSSLRETATL